MFSQDNPRPPTHLTTDKDRQGHITLLFRLSYSGLSNTGTHADALRYHTAQQEVPTSTTTPRSPSLVLNLPYEAAGAAARPGYARYCKHKRVRTQMLYAEFLREIAS